MGCRWNVKRMGCTYLPEAGSSELVDAIRIDHESNGPSLICSMFTVYPWYLRAYNGLAQYTCEVVQGGGVGYRGTVGPSFRKVVSLPMRFDAFHSLFLCHAAVKLAQERLTPEYEWPAFACSHMEGLEVCAALNHIVEEG